MRITVAAPAKVNLRLRVGARDPSGFHSLDTLFCSLHLADSVVLRGGEGSGPQLDVGYARPLKVAPDMGPPEENLAVRAARAVMERAGLERGPEIRLVKRIPAGAGLGGGSSDAAAVLRAMRRLYPGDLDGGDLMALGNELGSDVPFFVMGAAFAHGTGRGERLAALAPLPARPVVVVIPDFPVATAEAYRWLDQDREQEGTAAPDVPDQPIHGRDLTWDAVADEAVNHFEGPVFRRRPELETIRDRLREHGARPALLAGSGSTVFGVFDRGGDARSAADALTAADPSLRVLVTRTRTR
ncbi:MAG: 4-(cytidine 5'-diphospho)-2-C-methyl-D-erythritol kinase [Longimicrobiales bacterium]